MAIQLTDYIHASTVKGKVADARQVFLEGDVENVQQVIDTLFNSVSQIEGQKIIPISDEELDNILI